MGHARQYREMLSLRLGFMTLSHKSILGKQRCYSCGRIPYTQRQSSEDGRSLQRKNNDGTTDCILTIFSEQSNVTIADSVCIVLVSLLIQRWFKVCRKKYKGIWKALCRLMSETCTSQISGSSTGPGSVIPWTLYLHRSEIIKCPTRSRRSQVQAELQRLMGFSFVEWTRLSHFAITAPWSASWPAIPRLGLMQAEHLFLKFLAAEMFWIFKNTGIHMRLLWTRTRAGTQNLLPLYLLFETCR